MKRPERTFNIYDAKQCYIRHGDGVGIYSNLSNPMFAKYSPSYVLTNENIRWISGLTSGICDNVLTVAASGDQPMFYALRGAKHIDTFDVSFCAKVAMDIKSTALHKLSRPDYITLLNDMHNCTYDTGLAQILPSVPDASRQFVQNMPKCAIFSQGIEPIYYQENIPTESEYDGMRKKISQPFNFIWTDIESLHTHLTREYDVINLSNIFEYLRSAQMHDILLNLRPYVRPNGYIIAQAGRMGIQKQDKVYQYLASRFQNWAKIMRVDQDRKKPNSESVVVLQRTR